jgi:hypothetical protein
MLTDMQKATLKLLAQNDPELIQFLKRASQYIVAPRIFSYLLHNGINGKQLRELVLRDHGGDPEKFVKEMNKKINGKLI